MEKIHKQLQVQEFANYNLIYLSIYKTMARGSHSSPQRTTRGKKRKAVLKALKRLCSNAQVLEKVKHAIG